MTNKVKLLELVLRNHTLSNNSLVSKIQQEYKGMNFKEVTKFLKEYCLEKRTTRMLVMWIIEEILEENIVLNIHKSDEILILENSYQIAKKKFYKQIVSDEIFKFIIRNRGYKSINDMRAFAAICEGDMDTYKIYSGNSDKFLSYALLRVLAIANEYTDSTDKEKTTEILDLATEVLKTVYKEKNVEELEIVNVMKDNFKDKDFLLAEYKKVATKGEPSFAPGIFKMLKEYFEQNGDLETYEVIKNNFDNAFIKAPSKEKEEKTNEVVNEEQKHECENVENNATKDNTPIEINDELEMIEINIDEIGIETKEVEEKIEVEKTESIKEEKLTKEELKKEIQLRLKEIELFVNQIESTDEEESNQEEVSNVEELKNENIRLKNEVEILRKRISEVSLKDFIQRVGGRECGYQLSELYMLSEGIMEDDGNTQGRLINLFGILEGYSLEAYIGEYKINDEFEIDRKTLSQKYLLEMPLRGDDEVVKVKLIKNGWKYDSEIIVPPLVRQLF